MLFSFSTDVGVNLMNLAKEVRKCSGYGDPKNVVNVDDSESEW